MRWSPRDRCDRGVVAGVLRAQPGRPVRRGAAPRRGRLMPGRVLYDTLYRLGRAPWEIGPRHELVDLVEAGRLTPGRTLDLGCGTGTNAVYLAEHGFDVTGVDFSPVALAKA